MTRRKTGARRGSEATGRTGKQRRTPVPARPLVAYTEQQKIDAVAAMFSVNREHPMCAASLDAARKVLGAPLGTGTLGRWIAFYGGQVLTMLPSASSLAEAIADTQQVVIKDMIGTRDKALKHLNRPDAFTDTSQRDAAVVFGIMDDHIEKATGISPDDKQRFDKISDLCARLGADKPSVLDNLIGYLEQRLIAQTARALGTPPSAHELSAATSDNGASDTPLAT